eukprot:TRINITY_DN3773_c0_g1_i1.p1 TRINITY_DN3773_c0_g1~~TRINITY_DN3773_c0_g1_i1.p1  ORF type:complete len:364 (+),score=84.78 TRINITY_DN3773_c0_g1_i1:3-1094(+)
MLLVCFVLQGPWLNNTEHYVVNNPTDRDVAYVVPLGVLTRTTVPVFKHHVPSAAGAFNAVWKWEDDGAVWKQYNDTICQDIERQYQRHLVDSSVTTVAVQPVSLKTDNLQVYHIDLRTMTQVNGSTGYRRRVQREEAVGTGATRVFFFKDDNGAMVEYESQVQEKLMQAWRARAEGKGPQHYIFKFDTRPDTYRIDFGAPGGDTFQQTNLTTGATRIGMAYLLKSNLPADPPRPPSVGPPSAAVAAPNVMTKTEVNGSTGCRRRVQRKEAVGTGATRASKDDKIDFGAPGGDTFQQTDLTAADTAYPASGLKSDLHPADPPRPPSVGPPSAAVAASSAIRVAPLHFFCVFILLAWATNYWAPI